MTEKTAVHTPTKEEYDRLMKAYEKKGREWMGGGKPTVKRDFASRGGARYIQFCNHFCSTNLFDDHTIITVDEAIAKLGLYERGQEVLVRDHYIRCERIYLETIEGAISPYITVQSGDEDLFRKGKQFQTEEWQEIKTIPIEPTTLELTMKDIEDKYGCKVKIVK